MALGITWAWTRRVQPQDRLSKVILPCVQPLPPGHVCPAGSQVGMGVAVPDDSLYLQGQETALKPQSLSMGGLFCLSGGKSHV